MDYPKVRGKSYRLTRIAGGHVTSGYWLVTKGVAAGGQMFIACKTETLGSLYSLSHALFIPTKSKNQVRQEQKFKDPISNTCPVSSERRMFHLESEVNQRPEFNEFNPFCQWIFLVSCRKASDANIDLLPVLCLQNPTNIKCYHAIKGIGLYHVISFQ